MPRDTPLLSPSTGGRRSYAKVAHLVALGLGSGALSCGSTGAVSITVDVQNPVMTVSAPSALASQLSGSFSLHLELGKVAPSGADVTIGQGNFNLVDPAHQSTLVLLKFTTAPAAPYHLEPGGKLDIAFTIADSAGAPGQLVTKDEATSICAARAAVQIAGSFTDGANGSTPVNSASFAVGCP